MKVDKELLSKLYPFWDKLKEEDKTRLENGCAIVDYKKNEIVQQAAEGCIGILNILKGQLRIYIISDDGREVTLFRLREGEACVLSATCMLRSITFDLFIEATQETSAVLLPTYILHTIMDDNPYVELYLYKEATERFSDVMWTLQQILFMGVDKRLANYLWDESLEHGLELKTTHEEIAKNIGSAREVVSKTLKYMTEEGIVKLGRGKVTIVDKDKLKKLL